MLSLHTLHGAAVLAGALSADDIAALRASGVELLSLPPSGEYSGLEWCGAPPPGPLFAVYLKDYSDAEMIANTGGAAGFHTGWTLSAFVQAFTPLCDGARILSSPAAAVLRDAGVLSPAAVAALGGPGAE
jgi:hypothetical protein